MSARMASHVQGHCSLFQVNLREEEMPKVPIQRLPPLRKRQSGRGQKLERDPPIPKQLSNAPSKHTRRGTPKSKSGCKTCKIRHTRCDETKPGCKRCTETGRKCDYADVFRSSQKPPLPPLRRSSTSPKSRACAAINHHTGLTRPTAPLPAFEVSRQDGHYFNYIRCLTSVELTDVFGNDLWKLALQVCNIEPAIRHVALGMAMIHQIYGYIVTNPNDPSYLDIYYSGIRHYNKAIKALKERLHNVKGSADRMTWEVSLLAACLFTGFEVLIGNELGAYWQMNSGFKLMKNALTQYDSKSTALSLPGNLGALTLVWNRLDIQATTFSAHYETRALLAPGVPGSFISVTHAKDVLDIITSNILAVIRSEGPEVSKPDELPKELRTQLSELKATLQGWLDVFEGFLISSEMDIFENKNPKTEDIRATIAHHRLMIQYWLSFIWLYTPFSRSQTIHDAYLPAFTTITNLAEIILRLQPTRQWFYQLIADTSVVQPLFYVTQKCRDGSLRRRAHRLLAGAGREGVWDGQCSAAVCAWIIAKEEEGLEEGVVGGIEPGSKGFIEDKYRVKGGIVNYNRYGKMLTIACKRTREDGSEEVIEGFMKWGEVDGVVYGEKDKLWQHGALFG